MVGRALFLAMEFYMFIKSTSLHDLDTINHNRRLNTVLANFVSNLMWFMDIHDKKEKLGVVRMLLCNINSKEVLPVETRQKIDAMVNTVQELIQECTEKQN